jgi:hypothetical protein
MTIFLPKTCRLTALIVTLAAASAAGGCANDGGAGGMFTTGSLSQPAVAAAKPIDPACTTLAAQIDGLRKEGTVDRLEKAADGKTATVNIQRVSLSKQTQLNKANAEFIAKCGPALPKATVAAPGAALTPAATPIKTAAVAKATAAVKDAGVTVAAPAIAAAPAAAAAATAAKPQ